LFCPFIFNDIMGAPLILLLSLSCRPIFSPSRGFRLATASCVSPIPARGDSQKALAAYCFLPTGLCHRSKLLILNGRRNCESQAIQSGTAGGGAAYCLLFTSPHNLSRHFFANILPVGKNRTNGSPNFLRVGNGLLRPGAKVTECHDYPLLVARGSSPASLNSDEPRAGAEQSSAFHVNRRALL
jgi:hypothetical protein